MRLSQSATAQAPLTCLLARELQIYRPSSSCAAPTALNVSQCLLLSRMALDEFSHLLAVIKCSLSSLSASQACDIPRTDSSPTSSSCTHTI